MNIRTIFYIFVLGLFIAGFTATSSASASESAWFQLFSPEGVPMERTHINIYNGDIKFKAIGNMYPYGKAAMQHSHYLGEVITNDKGVFGLKVQNYRQHNLTLIVGSVYYRIDISKSDGLPHSRSDDHLRVIEWEDGSTRVKANHIYNWRKRTVVTIPLLQDPAPEKSSQYITLKAVYLPKVSSNIAPLTTEKEAILLEKLEKFSYDYNLRMDVHKALRGGDEVVSFVMSQLA